MALRLAWGLRLSNGHQALGQTSIKAVFSPLADKGDQAHMFLSSATDHCHQKEVWLAFSALPILTVRSLWQIGLKIAEPDYQLETFHDLQIRPRKKICASPSRGYSYV